MGFARRFRLSVRRRHFPRACRALRVRERRHAATSISAGSRTSATTHLTRSIPVQWPLPAGEAAARDRTVASSPRAASITPDRKARFIAPEPPAPSAPAGKDFPFRLNTGRVRDQWHTMTRIGLEPAARRACARAVRRGASCRRQGEEPRRRRLRAGHDPLGFVRAQGRASARHNGAARFSYPFTGAMRPLRPRASATW